MDQSDTPKEDAQPTIDEWTFRYYKDSGTKPEDLLDKEMAKKFSAWLANETAVRLEEVAWLMANGYTQQNAEDFVERMNGLGRMLTLDEHEPVLPEDRALESKMNALWLNDPYEGRDITRADHVEWRRALERAREAALLRLYQRRTELQDVAPRSRQEYRQWIQSHHPESLTPLDE